MTSYIIFFVKMVYNIGMNKLLIDLEEWNQSYDFNYNCMEGNARFYLEYSKNSQIDLKKFKELYTSGNNYVNNKIPKLTFLMAYGKGSKYKELRNLKSEVYKYLIELEQFCFYKGILLPKIETIDIEAVIKAFAEQCHVQSVNKMKTFDQYLNSIKDNTYYKIENCTEVCDLKNPLFYKLIISACSNFNKGVIEDISKYNNTKIWYDCFISIINQENVKKIA